VPVDERLEVAGPDGRPRTAQFKKAGIAALGDQPELYFFDLHGEDVVVGLSGEALREFQRQRCYLSREEKIDLAGLQLKRQIEQGRALVSESLFIGGKELEGLMANLGLPA